MNGEFKKDYEPYQALGPLTGIFDQRAAEKINHHADMYGFDAISVGGVVSWIMECLAKGYMKPEDVGVTHTPIFSPENFDVVGDSHHNAEIGIAILDSIIDGQGVIDMKEGARKFARHLARQHGEQVLHSFVYIAFARKGWMVPNQYWTPGVLSPMAIMGKYYMHYGKEFLPPRELGRKNAERMRSELVMDNLGICRFHRAWAEDMLPEIIGSLYNKKSEFLKSVEITATRINSRNSSVYWESKRNIDLVKNFLERTHVIENNTNPELMKWLESFNKHPEEAGLNYWYEIHKGITESLREF